MRHRKSTKILDRKTAPRKALIRSLAESLVIYEKIETTETKAKVLRPYVEKLITIGAKDDLTSRRKLLQKLLTKNAVNKVLEVLGPRYEKRPGGYTRIIKIGPRQGDGAKMVQISFV